MVRFLLICHALIVGCNQHYVGPTHGMSFKLIEKVPYAGPPDLAFEFTHRW